MEDVKRHTIRLNVKELMKAQIDKDIPSDAELASRIGVNKSQIWRAKLPKNHPKHNSPGPVFIAGVLNEFGGPFEKFFFLDEVMRGRSNMT